ncbi:hypothetical protein AOC36_01830 [Erysipelothrix larvae]|uniref:Ribonuclease R n=1 Tax=Erysipelothrix larvae TaxID=1514105 RepID=A0A0X8GYI7_9FIRM|nr:ribonuclease R [Erysipelothrix larvae]AMC92767.1 hypothetical protein AOC36_01830 [Erysipelothrix larvae]
MKHTDTQYEKVKQALFKANGTVYSVDTWIQNLNQTLGFSSSICESVFKTMKAHEELVQIDDLLYVIDKTHFRLGTLRVVRETFGFVGDKADAIYIGGRNFNGALDRDVVLVQCNQVNKQEEGDVIKVMERKRSFILGTFEKKGKTLLFKPYENKFPYNFEIKGEATPNQRVIIAVDRVKNGVVEGHVQSVLGLADEPGIDVISVLMVHDLEVAFNQDALDQAATMPDEVDPTSFEGRIDHRNQNVITVDGEDAKDLDDAIYLERKADGYRLYVHIADVSHYVTPKSPLDVNASERTSSIYLVDRVVPMLPKNLSNGVCSLHPNVDRLTLTCMMDIDSKGVVDNYAVYPSIIQSKRRMSYNEINQNDTWGNETDMIHDMLHCAQILHYTRNQAGSIDFESDEAKYVVDHEGNVLDIYRRTQGEAEAMIEAFMVCANETVARHCKYLEIPIMYRVHEKPDLEKVKGLSHTLRTLGYRMKGSLDKIHPKTLQKAMDYFKDRPEGPVVSRLMIRSMSKARYDQEPIGHFGLALEDYAHFTSPIRRYPDLWLHQCLRKYVFNHDFSHFNDDVQMAQDCAAHVSSKERDIMEAERDVEKIKKAQYMKDKKGEAYEGFISGFSNYGIFVELENTVEGVVPFRSMRDHMVVDMASQKAIGTHTNVTYVLGQKVNVKVESVDLQEHEVEFFMKEKRGAKKRVKYRKKS